ncbi:MAG: BofC C-terminal domain-containing protein [Bacillota bacterium]
MKLAQRVLWIILIVISTALISYYVLKGTANNNNDNSYLDSRIKNELTKKNNLAELIIRERNELDEQENLTQQQLKLDLIEEPLFSIGDYAQSNKDAPNLFEIDLKLEDIEKKLSKGQDFEFELDYDNVIITTEEINQGLDSDEFEKNIINFADLFLGIKDGYVAIYRGDILEDAELVKVCKDILLKNLAQEDIKRLQLGIEIDSKEELFSILEGFSSAKN